MVASLGNHPNKTSARAALVDSFGDDAIARTLSTLFAVVPDGAVKIGDRWESKLEWPLENLGKARFDRTFTLSGFENVKGKGSRRQPPPPRPSSR